MVTISIKLFGWLCAGCLAGILSSLVLFIAGVIWWAYDDKDEKLPF